MNEQKPADKLDALLRGWAERRQRTTDPILCVQTLRLDHQFRLHPGRALRVEKGYVLACQSHPVSSAVTLDYDKI